MGVFYRCGFPVPDQSLPGSSDDEDDELRLEDEPELPDSKAEITAYKRPYMIAMKTSPGSNLMSIINPIIYIAVFMADFSFIAK